MGGPFLSIWVQIGLTELDEELKRLQDSPSPPPTSEGVRETEVVVAICFQLHQGISQNTHDMPQLH